MKNVFKLTTAALALVAFASCSSDDVFNQNPVFGENTALVTIDDLKSHSLTRAGLAEDLSKTQTQVWEDGDKIRIYDENQDKNDVYEFTGSSFTLRGSSNLKSDPAKALFPSENVLYGAWGSDANKAVIQIPDPIVYTEFDNNGTTCYSSNLPAWGTAVKDDTYGVKVDLHYLTAALKITLDNVLSYGSPSLNITAEDDKGNLKNLSGAFVATLKDGAMLEEGTGLQVNPWINVDIHNVKTEHAVIYVPIPAGKYGKITITDNVGNTVLEYDKGFVAEVGHVYGKNFKAILDLSEKTVSAINTALISSQSNADDVEINVPDPGTTSTFDVNNALKMPKMACGVVTINIPTNDVVTNVAGNPTANTLTIQNQSKIDTFDGTLVLNVGAVATTFTDINIDLPGAKVVLEGDYTNIVNITTNVAELVFGDGDDTAATTANLTTLTLTNCDDLTVSADATVTAGIAPAAAKLTGTISIAGKLTGNVTIAANGKTTAIEVAKDATLTGDVTINNGAATNLSIAADGTLTGDVTVAATSTATEITVDGTLTGDVTINNAATLKIGGEAGKITGTSKGNVTTKGDVTVANTEENEAISGILKFNAAKTLTLTGGYIKCLDAGTNAITIANEEVIQTAIAAGTGANIKAYTSKWAGKTVDATNFAAYANAAEIWTATQFQGMDNNGAVAMKANVNLNSEEYAPIALADGATFDGNGKTVSGLILVGSNDTDNVGLFSTVNGAVTIQNLTISGVTTDVTKAAAVGALVGDIQSTDDVVIKKVSVTGEGTFGSTAAISNVGGLVGKISGTTATDKKVAIGAADNAVSVSLGAISGAANLGGLIGAVSGKSIVEIAKSSVTLNDAFSVVGVSTWSESSAVVTAGTVGNFIGTINDGNAANLSSAKAEVTVKDYTATNKIAGNRAAYGYKYNWTKNAADKRCAFFGNNNVLNGGCVGYSPSFNTLTIGDKTYKADALNLTKYADIENETNNYVNVFVFVDNWSDQ